MMQDLIPVNGSESMERCQLGSCVVDLPEDICEQRILFKEVVSEETWNSVLSSEQRNYLLKFLPRFPENDALNKQETIRSLLSGNNFWFGNPTDVFHKKLKGGQFSPDVARMTLVMKKAKYCEYRHRQRRYFYKLLQDILVSRKSLIETASRLPPDQPLRMDRTPVQPKSHPPLAYHPVDSLHVRSKRRYARELQEVREEVGELQTSSDDDNFSDAVPPKLTKKQKKHLSQIEASLATEVGRVTSTMAPKPPPVGSGSSRAHVIRSISPFEVNEDDYRNMIALHKRRRADPEYHLELDVEGITLNDISSRTNIPKRSSKSSQSESASKVKGSKDRERKKSLVIPATVIVKTEPGIDDQGEISDNIPLLIPKLEPLSSPVDMGDTNFNVSASADDADTALNVGEPSRFMESVESRCDPNFGFALPRSSTPGIVQADRSSFFSLLRDFFYEAYDCKILPSKLEEKVATWQDSSYRTLKDWYLFCPNWVELVVPALKFLSGQVAAPVPENFVPLVDYKAKLQYYHWSGEGRDSDENLEVLSTFWLHARSTVVEERPPLPEITDHMSDSPPPPRVLTDWLVQTSTDDEKTLYREQERHRYDNPHRAFTFCLHGYEAIVGPVKGVYGKDGSVAKAREHSLLTSDRPPFVTILSLVRDSAARLPNGEGTRADICELLKDSQFLANATDIQIHTVVSGALDRLHYEKDPCVKYDVNRKMWIYLHRCRTEEEFERIHQAHATIVKTKKVGAKQKSKPMRSKAASRPASAMSTTSSDSLISLEISNTSIGGTSASTGSFTSTISPITGVTPTVTPSLKSRTTSFHLKAGTSSMIGAIPVNTSQSQLTVPSPMKAVVVASSAAPKAKSSVAQKSLKKKTSIAHVTPTLPTTPTSLSVVTKAMPTTTSKVAVFSQPSTLAVATICPPTPTQQTPVINVSLSSGGNQSAFASTFKPVSQLVGRVDIPDRVIQTASENVTISSPALSQTTSSRTSLSDSLHNPPSSKTVAMTGGNEIHLSGSSVPGQLGSTADASSNNSQISAIQRQQTHQQYHIPKRDAKQNQLEHQEQQQVHQNKLIQKHYPSNTLESIKAQPTTARAVTINSQSVSTVRLVSSSIGPSHMNVALSSKAVGSSPALIGQPMSMNSSSLQGTMAMPTIVIKQQDSMEGNQITTSHQQMKAAPMKPVVARIISTPQVVSVGNLIASTLTAAKKQGSHMQGGTTTIKIHSANLLHPMANAAGHLNVLKTPTSACPSAALHQVSTSATGIPRLALVSQGSTANLIPVSSTTVTVQPKLIATAPTQIGIVTSQQAQVTKPTILTTPAGIKIVSAATTTSMTLSQLTGKTTQTMVMPSKPQTPIVTVSVGTASGTTQNLILTGSGVQSTAIPAVVITSRSLKPAQTVVMAQPTSTTPTVMMTAQSTLRPIASTAIRSGGVKVIPVTQTTTFGDRVGIGKISQPMFTRIITPPAGLAIRPGASVTASTQQGIGLFHTMSAHHMPAAGVIATSGGQTSTVRGAHASLTGLQQATIIRVQAPIMTPNPQLDNPRDAH